jgi:hypothetical protein
MRVDTNSSPPSLPVNDKQTAEQLRRGLMQEIKGLREQLQGKRQQLSAVEKHLGIEKDWGT